LFCFGLFWFWFVGVGAVCLVYKVYWFDRALQRGGGWRRRRRGGGEKVEAKRRRGAFVTSVGQRWQFTRRASGFDDAQSRVIELELQDRNSASLYHQLWRRDAQSEVWSRDTPGAASALQSCRSLRWRAANCE
jgi:hypothetical protein